LGAERRAPLHVKDATTNPEENMLKPLIIAGAVLFATTAFAQQQPQTPGTGQPNAQGEQQKPGQTMQEKDSSITNKDPKTQGTTGSGGTQSGPTPSAAPSK
jgi:hypothetical protein